MLGAKCVNALSDELYVVSSRDRKQELIKFKNGVKVKHEITDLEEDNHGLYVLFKPSSKYLETTKFDSERLKNMIQEFSFLCKGLTFKFIEREGGIESTTYYSENGLYDYLEYLNNGKDYLCKPFYFEAEEDTFKVEVAFAYNDSYSSIVKLYTNNIPQIKGTHLTGFKTAFTATLNSFAREKKWLKEKDNNLQGSDFEEGQLLIVNFRMIDPVFKGQNKEELSSSEGRTYVQKFTSETLKELFAANEKEVKKIVDKALSARSAREAAKKAREAIRANQKKKKEKALKFDSKLADCYSKDRSKCEIFITEGKR